MREFRNYFLVFVLLFFVGCDSEVNLNLQKNKCPECHMNVAYATPYSSQIKVKGEDFYFDDIGCMVIYAYENNVDIEKFFPRVLTKDTKKYVPILQAKYKIGDNTPMSYGFAAYENEGDGMITYDEVVLKMLRGEHMANPKIRKKVLGQ
ncbi:MAG: hypothetical protein OQK11_05045 [Thiovulaceae bacterium]|nr:hypothetical protein [Sulfurimonadaceae bacterium]